MLAKRRVYMYLLAIMLVFQSLFFQSSNISKASAESLGSIIEEWSRPVGPGVHESLMTFTNDSGRQEAFVLSIDTEDPNIHIEVGLPNGKDFGMQTVRGQAAAVSKPGHTVIGGVNGDFYNTSNGIPIGSVIRDGKILQAMNTETFGIKNNGEAIIGIPNPTFSLIVKGVEKKIDSLNGTRGANQLIAFTSDKQSTGTDATGTEVILSLQSGDIREVGSISAKVENVIIGKGNTEIPEGTLVLSGHGAQAEFLQTFQNGQMIDLNTNVAPGWENVKEALGGRITLVKNGEKVNIPESSFTTTLAPRTAAGIKSDGTIFFIVLDGRQPGYAEGVTIYELQDIMFELGAVDALNLDGGGSSTFLTRTNGEDGLTLGNTPSDGFERSVANSFLVVSKAEQGGLEQLAVQPDHLLILSGSTYGFTAKGMDAAYNPVELNQNPQWSVTDTIMGTIDSTGKFVAGNNPASGKINANINGAKGTSDITVIDELTDLQFSQDTVTLKRGDELKLELQAFSNGRKVHANPSNFEWEITGDIGAIDETGMFKATNTTATGTITASYGDKSATMNIQVGKLPVIIETFENGLEDWTWSGARYQSVGIRQTTYPEPARFGNHALELNYDFTGTIGTSGAYAHTKEDIILDDYPEAIGMWVYGDGNGHWLRAQMRDGNNNAFPIDFVNNMDWTGWKYVEAVVPTGKVTPLKLDLAVRLMETSDDNKNAGTIYVDNIRAVYGETNDDLTNPEITGEYPAANEVIAMNELKISAIAADNEGGTGINPERLWMYVDGKEVKHEFIEETGEISFTPNSSLLDGYHQVKIVVQDHFGNESERVWQFEIDSGGVGVKPVFEKEAYIGNPFAVVLEANKINEMESMKLHFSFDKDKVSYKEAKVILHENIKDEHVLRNEIIDGHIYLELRNLDKIDDAEKIKELGKLFFTMNKGLVEDVSIKFVEGMAAIKGESTPIFMPDINIKAKAHYKIDVDRASVGFESKISVTEADGKGKRVKGAVVKIISSTNEVTLGTTDGKGEIKTKQLTKKPGEFIIQAEKDKEFSFLTNVKVLDHLGTKDPERINLTFSQTNNAVNVNWTTSPLTKESVVEVVPTEEFARKGFSGNKVKTVKGDSKQHAFDAGEIQVHSVTLKGLKEKSSYTYRVGNGSKTGWSVPASFTTSQKKNSEEPFNFILMGDTQAPPNQTENGFGLFTELFTKAKQENEDAAFIVHVGDMIDDGNLYSHWDAFFESMKNPNLAPSIPFVPTIGNHENIGNGVETFKQLFKLPDNGPENFKGTVYSFDYGDAHFAVLNTETSKQGLIEQAEWLEKDMAKTKKKWKIVIYHRSPYNSNPAAGSEAVKEVWPPVFDKLNIDLAISGHDHSYVRTLPLKDGKVNNSGTTYLIAGSTGKKFYAATPQDYMDIYFDEETQIYTNVSIDKQGIKLLAKTRDGRVIDNFTIQKKN